MDNETTTDAPETFRDRIKMKLENPKIKKIGTIAVAMTAVTTAVAGSILSVGMIKKFSEDIEDLDQEPTEDDLELETTTETL